MKCKDCSYFKILYDPIGKWPDLWDFGKAKCKKYDLVADFTSTRNLNKLECIGDEYKTETMSELAKENGFYKNMTLKEYMECMGYMHAYNEAFEVICHAYKDKENQDKILEDYVIKNACCAKKE